VQISLIIGVPYLNGSCLADFLKEKGRIVRGIKRFACSFNAHRTGYVCQGSRIARQPQQNYGDISNSQEEIVQVPKSQRRKCLKKWSPKAWSKQKSMLCSKPMVAK
jgi:GDP-D-mannose dehydratase